MAQRTGDKRLLKTPAATASARFLLALAAAALALAGCGGGSSAPGAGAASSTPGADSAPGSPAPAGSPAPGGREDKGKKAPPGAIAAGEREGAARAGKKHGKPLVAPKGPPERAPTPAQIQNATVADIGLTSPAIQAGAGGPGALPSTYTCDGADSWPELRFSGVPAASAELILYAMSLKPVGGRLFVDWAVAGLDPGLGGIQAGKLPQGAILATNSFGKRGYEICPPPGSGEIYVFALYALPSRLGLATGFDAREARREILDKSGNVGLLPATYARG